jgi:hypothetical protein
MPESQARPGSASTPAAHASSTAGIRSVHAAARHDRQVGDRELRAEQGRPPAGPAPAPPPPVPETAPITNSKLLSGRAAAIIGASFVIAVCAGTLTYLTAGRSSASLAGAILVGAAAFAGAIRLLDSIIG